MAIRNNNSIYALHFLFLAYLISEVPKVQTLVKWHDIQGHTSKSSHKDIINQIEDTMISCCITELIYTLYMFKRRMLQSRNVAVLILDYRGMVIGIVSFSINRCSAFSKMGKITGCHAGQSIAFIDTKL